ncbi:uncharacterized protein LOC129796666 isoform X1 [Lutzomyia longipalpis]|uniref:uncharacterized protein LOC129796666 isoform X1 n=1 Tax=Lutzomyia longipalpis TaxID=7200 RepID=UPI0024834004|nr:uncharacterized protein LOC129796666 isoform X1 [Lutzomyia longipalpis]
MEVTAAAGNGVGDLLKGTTEGLSKREKCNRNAEVACSGGAAGEEFGGESSDSMEKCDVSPENSAKKDTPPEANGGPPSRMTTSASAILAQQPQLPGNVQYGEIPKSISLFEVCAPNQEGSQPAPPSPKHAMAFTIDFGGRADEQRYRSMYEKFQNRHRRGVSLTKFDVPPPPARTKIPMSAKLPRKQIPTPTPAPTAPSAPEKTAGVKLRDKSRLQAPQDASKRHSWSPRSSTAVPAAAPPPEIRTKFTPRSLTLAKALEGKKSSTPLTSEASSVEEIPCPVPPLQDSLHPGEDQVSEAGTYTLDADNYTEEQKERMNIDLPEDLEVLQISESPGATKPERPTCFETNLETFDYDLSSQRDVDGDDNLVVVEEGIAGSPKEGKSGKRRNVLEISCSHETSTAKPKVSYLERLKNRVKNISDRTFHKSRSPDKLLPSPDVGTFTSVTTSGILSVKPTLESNPRLTRRNSLTKSQIDNSEYVQGVSRLNVVAGGVSSGGESVRSSPKRGMESAIKSAATKSDWIQEWARHARQHSAQMSRSYTFESPTTEEGLPGAFVADGMSRSGYEGGAFARGQLGRSSMRGRFDYGGSGGGYNEVPERRRREVLENRPPVSPTKIPSPVGTLQRRPRSRSSSTRSHQGSQTDLSNDTDVYLQKTAAAITTLQKIHRDSLQNSPKSPESPKIISPESGRSAEEYLLLQLARMHKYHRRNHSLDGTEGAAPPLVEFRRHARHHSYESSENLPPRPMRTALQSFIDGERGTDFGDVVARRRPELIKHTSASAAAAKEAIAQQQQKAQCSPIRRSTSFSAKTPNQTGTPRMPSKIPPKTQSIQKSASSSNFRTVVATYGDDDIMEFIINDNVDLDVGQLSSGSDLSGQEEEEFGAPAKPITNTRCNKAFLMRMEQNRRPVSHQGAKPGAIACPNTPEMRRREPNVRTSFRERMSMPRDSSLNRMKQDLARRQQPQPQQQQQPKEQQQLAKVQPRYMDISKYKPVTGANFLKKDESKSYLLHREVKKSPSSASVNLNRGDAQRASNRSVKSAGMRPSSGKKEPPAPQKQAKEAELAMWKRRASYDPMKAALEGKRKQDEARRLAQQQQSKLGESSSAVLRSQSFHSGVSSQLKANQMAKTTIENQWTTLALSDSSDDNES